MLPVPVVPKKHSTFFGGCALVASIYLFLALRTVWYGPYNPDEGWYLQSAWLTWHGYLPYRDFAFPQPPLVLLVHGFFQVVFGSSFYLGRLVNMSIGLLGMLLTSWVAYRLSGKSAALVTGLLLAASGWFVVQMVSVSTYALAALLLVALVYAWYKKSWVWIGVLSVLVVWTRFSLLPVIPLTILAALVRMYIEQKSWDAVGRFAVGVGLVGTLFVAPFLVLAPGHVWLNIIGYHTLTRQTLVEQVASDTSTSALLDKLVIYFQEQYSPVYKYAWLAALTSLIVFVLPATAQIRTKRWLVAYIFLLAVPIALAHALAENITYDVPLLGMLALAGGIGIAGLQEFVPKKHWLPQIVASAVVALVIALSFWSTHDLYNGVGEHEESPSNIQRIVRYIDEHSAPQDFILTPELYISLQARRRGLPGTELGRFFYFPQLSDDEARRRGVMNDAMLAQAISSRKAKFIIISSAHFWEQLPDTPEEHQRVTDEITQAGYALVPSLNELQPAIEITHVYERID